MLTHLKIHLLSKTFFMTGIFWSSPHSFYTGFGDETDADCKTVDQMVKTLKEEIKYLHTIVLVFNGKVFTAVKLTSLSYFHRTEREVHPGAEKHDQSVSRHLWRPLLAQCRFCSELVSQHWSKEKVSEHLKRCLLERFRNIFCKHLYTYIYVLDVHLGPRS